MRGLSSRRSGQLADIRRLLCVQNYTKGRRNGPDRAQMLWVAPFLLCVILLIVRGVLGNSWLLPSFIVSLGMLLHPLCPAAGLRHERTSSALGSASNLRHGPARPSMTWAPSSFGAGAGRPLAPAFCPLCCSSSRRWSSPLLPARLLTGGCCGVQGDLRVCPASGAPG